MNTIKIIIFLLIMALRFSFIENSYSQFDSCGTVMSTGESATSSTFIGGKYKPHRTDIGGSPSGLELDYFPIIVVFVQYQGETGGNFPGNPDSINAWPAGSAPNYFSKVITKVRAPNSSSWWDSYNGYEINDYWHEFARGKLHIRGEAFSVILQHTKTWYDSNGAHAKVNKDIYDYLKDSTPIDWPFYDQWTTTSEGNFLWQPDGRVDMLYMVYRNRINAYLTASGIADLGPCQGVDPNTGEYIVYQSGNVQVRINGSFYLNGSGTRTDARADLIYSRHKFLDIGTHEHGHYLFGGGHKTFCHMTAGAGWEFSLSPWEMVKLGYMQQKFVNYSNPAHLLYDYSSRYGTADSTGEVLQIPITTNGNEFFLIANRRKVSEWDRRMSGDTLADDGYQALKNINQSYGKGIYIYHITNGYNGASGNEKVMDLECADGLWNWENSGITRPPTWSSSSNVIVFKKVSPSYYNDSPSDASTLFSRDEMSFYYATSNGGNIWHSPGSRDLFNPLRRGVTNLYTNDNDYWYSLAVAGDRWDAWNVGYNEIFSPYSSPNSLNVSNGNSGIFVWYKAIDTSAKKATLMIYRVDEEHISPDSILHLTPPSRPMGIVVDYYIESENISRPIITWNHNKEPDMLRDSLKKRYKIWRATQTNMSYVPTNYTLLKTLDIDSGTAPSYIDTSIVALGSGWPGMGAQIEYPVRYTIQAIDKYADSSVRSDFGSIIGLIPFIGCPACADDLDNFKIINNLPEQYKLYNNYPNPFNPSTNIQYDLPSDNFVTIKIYDILGKEVMILVNEFRNAGSYIVSFNASNLSSGIYYYKIKTGSFEQIRKMILLK